MQAVSLILSFNPIALGSNYRSKQGSPSSLLNPLRRTSHAGTSSFAFLGSATLAQNQALQARRENFCCAKLGPYRVFASLLALGQNLSGFRIAG